MDLDATNMGHMGGYKVVYTGLKPFQVMLPLKAQASTQLLNWVGSMWDTKIVCGNFKLQKIPHEDFEALGGSK